MLAPDEIISDAAVARRSWIRSRLIPAASRRRTVGTFTPEVGSRDRIPSATASFSGADSTGLRLDVQPGKPGHRGLGERNVAGLRCNPIAAIDRAKPGDEPPVGIHLPLETSRADAFVGTRAARSRLDGVVDDEAFLAVMAGLDPVTGERLGRRFGESSVRGFDATFSAPKSVSVLFAVGDQQLRREVTEAHDRAVDAVLVGWSPGRTPGCGGGVMWCVSTPKGSWSGCFVSTRADVSIRSSIPTQ